MNKEQIELLGEYIKNTEYPILIEEIPETVIQKGAVVINSDCTKEQLIGEYRGTEYIEPEWYRKIKQIDGMPILIIDKINEVSEKEQRKFIELLKYRKAYIYKLPEKCKVFVTYLKEQGKSIEEEVYSFLIQM